MATETEALLVNLEARVTQFEKNFQRANRTANDNFGSIERRAKKSADTLERSMSSASSRVAGVFKNFGAGVAGGILGGLSVVGLQKIVGAMGDVANGIAMIGSNAKKAGLSNRAFQELSYVAGQARIPVDALADGMKELALRADEFVTTGGGSGAESFKRLGYGAEELETKLKDPSGLLVDIIARLQQLDRAAQIRVSDELFGGTAGERFVELIGKGSDGIRQMIQEANDFGLVLDDQMIAKADEIDRKFNLISQTVSTKLKGAIVSATGELMQFMDRLRDVEDRQSATLGDELSSLGRKRLDNEHAILKLKSDKENTIGGALLGGAYDKQIAKLEQEQKEIAEAEARILKILGDRDKKAEDEKKAAASAVPDISKLNSVTAANKDTSDKAAKGMYAYADAIRALKGEIPELAEQVAELNMRADIDKAYRAALQNARSIGQVNNANALRDQALAAIPGRLAEIRARGEKDTSKEAREKAQQQIEAYGDIIANAKEFITSQQQEATALGMSKDAAAAYRHEQEMLNQAKRDGIELTADQKAEIAQYAQGMAQAEKATEGLAQSQEDAAELSKFFGDSMIDAIAGIADGSQTALGALRQLIAALAKMALQAAILGEGPLAGPLKGTGGIMGGLTRQLTSSTSPAALSTAPAIAPAGTPSQANLQLIAQPEETYSAPLEKVTREALAPIADAAKDGLGLRGTIDEAVQRNVSQAMPTPSARPAISAPAMPTPAKGSAFDFLMGRTDKPASHIKGLKTDFQDRLAAFMQDPTAPKGLGIYSGARSVERQRELWNAALKKYGSPEKARKWVAPPGKSNHGFGEAADLSYNGQSLARAPKDVVDWAHRNAGNYGLKFPLGNENWHVEMQETRGGKPFAGLRPRETVPPGLDMAATGSIPDQAAQQAQAQIEAQKRLAEQMAMTQQATQSMTQPLQSMGQAATQVTPNLGGMTQDLTGLLGPLMQMPGATGQAGQGVMSLIQQLLSMPMGGGGGIGGMLGGLMGFAGGGSISGPGTSTSDSIPILASDGEFMVNAKAAKKHRRVLEAINAGKAPALATDGVVRAGNFASSHYNPVTNINVTGQQGPDLAARIANKVDQSLQRNKPDGFRRSEGQTLAAAAGKMQTAGRRNA